MCPGSTFSAFKLASCSEKIGSRNYAGRPPISLRWQIESVADARALATGSEQFRHTAYLTSNIRIARSPLPQANQACRGRGLKKGIGGPLTIERLVDAITGGTLAVALHDRLALLEDRRLQLEGSAVNRGHPRAAPPPNLADVYRQRVAELTRVLEADNAAEAPELVRSLVETITLVVSVRSRSCSESGQDARNSCLPGQRSITLGRGLNWRMLRYWRGLSVDGHGQRQRRPRCWRRLTLKVAK